MMKVVVDTNVAISGLLWHGPPNQILKWARDGILRIIGCERTVSELNKVIRYKKFANRLSSLKTEPAEVFAYFMNQVFFVPTPESVPELIRDDPFDNIFLAVASANNAGLIISGDSHLLSLKEYNGIQIVIPSEACEAIETVSAKKL